MAHRSFVDAQGRQWEVWDVNPTVAQRHAARSIRARASGKVEARNAALPASLLGGWLAFESGKERRRLSPIPDDWESLDDRELAALAERAAAPTHVRRLVE